MIPAVITSTAVVAGLMCLELYKLLQQKPLGAHKHGYFNLSLPLFAFAQPLKAAETTVRSRYMFQLFLHGLHCMYAF